MEFKEIGRVKINDTTWIVISEMLKGKDCKGYSISKYQESEAYTGWMKGGVSVSSEYVIDFLKLFGKDNLKEALDDLLLKEWRNLKVYREIDGITVAE